MTGHTETLHYLVCLIDLVLGRITWFSNKPMPLVRQFTLQCLFSNDPLNLCFFVIFKNQFIPVVHLSTFLHAMNSCFM